MKLSISILLAFSFLTSTAQTWEWAIPEKADLLTLDPSGDIFAAKNNGLKKISSSGSSQWELSLAGEFSIRSIISDLAGDLYLSASFTTFSCGTLNLSSNGERDILFLKVSGDGSLVWHKQYGGGADDLSAELCMKSGNILLSGNAGSAINVEGNTLPEAGFFLAEFLPDGSPVDLSFYSGAGISETVISGAHLYLLGQLQQNDTLTLGPGHELYGCTDGCPGTHYMAKLDLNGNVVWALDMGSSYYDPHRNLTLSQEGNIYLSRWVRYGGFTISNYTSQGEFSWSNNLDGIYGDCSSMCVNTDNSLWVAGDLWNGDETGEPFIWKFTPAGIQEYSYPDNSPGVSGFSVCSNQQGHVFISGSYQDSLGFGQHTLTSSGGTGFFIARLNPSGMPTGTELLASEQHMLQVYPNPGTGIFNFEFEKAMRGHTMQIRIWDIKGRSVYEDRIHAPAERCSIDLGANAPGVYSVEILSGTLRRVKRIIIN